MDENFFISFDHRHIVENSKTYQVKWHQHWTYQNLKYSKWYIWRKALSSQSIPGNPIKDIDKNLRQQQKLCQQSTWNKSLGGKIVHLTGHYIFLKPFI